MATQTVGWACVDKNPVDGEKGRERPSVERTEMVLVHAVVRELSGLALIISQGELIPLHSVLEEMRAGAIGIWGTARTHLLKHIKYFSCKNQQP